MCETFLSYSYSCVQFSYHVNAIRVVCNELQASSTRVDRTDFYLLQDEVKEDVICLVFTNQELMN